LAQVVCVCGDPVGAPGLLVMVRMFLIFAVAVSSLNPTHETHASKVAPAPPAKAEGPVAEHVAQNTSVTEPVVKKEIIKAPPTQALTAERTKLRRGHAEQTLVVDKEPTHEEFNTACVSHMEGILAMILREYGPAQMETVLEHDCEHGELFPASHGGHSGFSTPEQCRRFAAQLMINKDGADGLQKFCHSFYGLTHANQVRSSKEPKERVAGHPGWFGLAFLAFATVCVIGLISFAIRGVPSTR